MAGGVNTPRWDKGLQHQQRPPNQRPGQQRTQQRRFKDHGGFDSSILDKVCMFELANGKTLQGLVVAAAKYWYMLNVDGQVVIVNKAYIVSITPVQSQNKKDGAGTLVDVSVSGGANHGSRG